MLNMFKAFNVFFLFGFSLAVSASEYDFVRFMKLEQTENGGELRTIYREYENTQGGPVIAYFGMVHTASPSFYEYLFAEMNEATAVLYEYIGDLPKTILTYNEHPECLEARKLQYARDLAEGLQEQVLAFSSQYTNFNDERYVHADLMDEKGNSALDQPKERCSKHIKGFLRKEEDHMLEFWFSERIQKRKEGTPYDFLPSFKEPQNSDDVIEFYKKNPVGNRKLIAQVVRDFLENRATTDAADRERTLQREEILYSKLESVLAQKTSGKILITYGAAHGPRIEKTLRERFGYQPKSEKWILVHRY